MRDRRLRQVRSDHAGCCTAGHDGCNQREPGALYADGGGSASSGDNKSTSFEGANAGNESSLAYLDENE